MSNSFALHAQRAIKPSSAVKKTPPSYTSAPIASTAPVDTSTAAATSKPNKRDKQWNRVLNTVDFIRDLRMPEVPLKEDPLLPQVESIVLAADDRKAADIRVFRVSHLTEITSFIIIVEGNSKPQNQAISNLIDVRISIHVIIAIMTIVVMQ